MRSEMKTLTLFLPLFSHVLAWGEIGHRTVGYLAQLHFTTDGEKLFDELVKPNDKFDISDGAVWADSFNVQSRMPFSKPWHYIDAKDDPPNKCQIRFNADCPEDKNCVVGAITNLVSHAHIWTGRLLGGVSDDCRYMARPSKSTTPTSRRETRPMLSNSCCISSATSLNRYTLNRSAGVARS
jgi:hypothetical protein